MPDHLDHLVKQFHPDPRAWWYSVLANHYLGWDAETVAKQVAYFDHLDRRHPILVGIHIRRQDKVTNREMQFIATERYLDKLMRAHPELHRTPFDLYLATDDSVVVNEMGKLISNNFLPINLLFNMAHIHTAHPGLRERSNEPLTLLLDIYVLSQADYIVCTMSSNLGRLLYLYAQAKHLNPVRSQRFISLDDQWYLI